MAKYLTEMQELQAALARCNLSENVLPTKNGFLIENLECYNKIQKMLECDELEASHRFLFNLDPDEITPGDEEKVDKLYNLACDRGFIEPEVDDSCVEPEADPMQDPVAAIPDAQAPVTQPVEAPKPFVSQSFRNNDAFTIMYSACTSDGRIKTGEVYSNALDTRSAKADAIAKLEKAGYHSISILCIEAGDPDSCGAPDATYGNGLSEKEDAVEPEDNSTEDNEEGSEDEEDSEEVSEEEIEEAASNSEDVDSFFNIGTTDEAEKDDSEDEEDSEEDDGSDEEDEGSDEEDDGSEEADNSDELSAEDKEKFKKEYTTAWKDALTAIKAKIPFSQFDLDTKIKFFEKLAKEWGDKPTSDKFLNDKDTIALEKTAPKK